MFQQSFSRNFTENHASTAGTDQQPASLDTPLFVTRMAIDQGPEKSEKTAIGQSKETKTETSQAPGKKTFEEFWPEYLRAHSHPATRAIHYLGTSLGLVTAGACIATGNWHLLPLAPVVAYGTLFPSHYLIEKNTPKSLDKGSFFLSMRGDFKMFGLALTGRLKPELKRLGIEAPKQEE